MEVDQTGAVAGVHGKFGKDKGKKGKGDGKGKDETKGKKGKYKNKPDGGKDPPAKFEGYCGFCEKWGHKRAGCRTRIAKGGKGGAHAVQGEGAPGAEEAGSVRMVAAYSGVGPSSSSTDAWCFAVSASSKSCAAVSRLSAVRKRE